jgi:hypothetical protein
MSCPLQVGAYHEAFTRFEQWGEHLFASGGCVA